MIQRVSSDGSQGRRERERGRTERRKEVKRAEAERGKGKAGRRVWNGASGGEESRKDGGRRGEMTDGQEEWV